MRPSNVVRLVTSMFVVLPALLLPPSPVAATSQLNEYDGSLCRLLQSSMNFGFASTFDGTGNMIQPNGNTGSVSFLCPATLSSNIANQMSPYAVKNLIFTIDLKINPTNAVVTPACQEVVDSLAGATTVNNYVLGNTDSNTYSPVTRVYYVCTAPGLPDPLHQQYYLRSYQFSVAYQV